MARRIIDGGFPVTLWARRATTLASYADTSARVAATLLTALGSVALLLAALGIYGVVANSVNQRTREIGIRVALGAQRLDVVWLFVRQGLYLAGLGVGVGAAGTLAAAPVLSSLLIGVSAGDPLSYLAVTALLAGVALLACWLPARRAAKVDPLVALRYE